MAENIFKVFFIISYESNLANKIKYSLSKEKGIDHLKISSNRKFKNDDKKEYIISVFSFNIKNLKEENLDEKTNLFKANINFTIKKDVYKEQITFKGGRYNFIYNFQIENNPYLKLLSQSSQLKIFIEFIKEQKANKIDDLKKALILDSINFLKENNEIFFDFYLEVLSLCYLKKERNSVLLNFQLKKMKLKKMNLNPNYTFIFSHIEKNLTIFCNENDDEEKEK